MPELPEVEAWRRELDPLVKRFPIEQAGPAHIATLKTIEPPTSSGRARIASRIRVGVRVRSSAQSASVAANVGTPQPSTAVSRGPTSWRICCWSGCSSER